MRYRSWLIVCSALLVCAAVQAQKKGVRDIPVPPPPMGWSSWNSFSNTVNSQIVMDQARAMAANGMQKGGYRQINIDEGWWLGQRDAQGGFVIDEKAWPALKDGEKAGDMANIARFIHSLGLKAGIYTDAGRDGCSMFPDLGPAYPNVGSEGHYEQDFLQFARWGFDYVKVDWCGGNKENLDPAVQYAEIARAIERAEKETGQRLYFSICNWGKDSPWTWAPHAGGIQADVWRTSGDIVDPIVASGKNAGRKAGFDKMLANFDQGVHPEAQHTGFYNDPDMMVIGMPGFSDAQNRVHLSLWVMSGAPLLVGADLAKLTAATLTMLTNPDVVAIDQDALGLQAVKVAEPQKGLQVWAKPLARKGTRAGLLLNRTTEDASLALSAKDLGLQENEPAKVRDLWSGKDLGPMRGSQTIPVAAGDAVLVRVEGADIPAAKYLPTHSVGIEACAGCELTFARIAGRGGWSRVRIVYTNSGRAERFAMLKVNEQVQTSVGFPPTGQEAGSVNVMVRLDRPGQENNLRISTANGESVPSIEEIQIP